MVGQHFPCKAGRRWTGLRLNCREGRAAKGTVVVGSGVPHSHWKKTRCMCSNASSKSRTQPLSGKSFLCSCSLKASKLRMSTHGITEETMKGSSKSNKIYIDIIHYTSLQNSHLFIKNTLFHVFSLLHKYVLYKHHFRMYVKIYAKIQHLSMNAMNKNPSCKAGFREVSNMTWRQRCQAVSKQMYSMTHFYNWRHPRMNLQFLTQSTLI